MTFVWYSAYEEFVGFVYISNLKTVLYKKCLNIPFMLSVMLVGALALDNVMSSPGPLLLLRYFNFIDMSLIKFQLSCYHHRNDDDECKNSDYIKTNLFWRELSIYVV